MWAVWKLFNRRLPHMFVYPLHQSAERPLSVARPRRDDGLRFGKVAFEIRAFARADVEDRHFEDHFEVPLAEAADDPCPFHSACPLQRPLTARIR
jgi:hypothetical protein